MIDSLIYIVCTRPNIAFVIDGIERYLFNSDPDRRAATKEIMRYLRRTLDYMLVYKKIEHFKVIGYFDLTLCVVLMISSPRYVSWRSHILEKL